MNKKQKQEQVKHDIVEHFQSNKALLFPNQISRFVKDGINPIDILNYLKELEAQGILFCEGHIYKTTEKGKEFFDNYEE
jgi:predicted transcriptional regulator